VALGRLAAPGVDALSGVKDCPISGAKLPLIIISHGHGGWFGQHNDLNEALADAGFIVAGINHPGDTVDDLREEDPMSIWTSRPRDVTRLIDFLLNDWKDKAAIDRDRIGFFGFSLGAYTGLVLLGAKADFRRLAAWCKPEGKWKPCEQARSGHVAASPPPDPRIRAGVLADNALSFAFAPEALATIQVPLQFWRSELGGHGVNAESTASTASNLPAASETHIVPAGHYAFLAPCTVQVAAANPRICVDAPPDFDRAAFHRTFDTEVVRFFSAHLPK
jgi:predicted dienelactone hydrolase